MSRLRFRFNLEPFDHRSVRQGYVELLDQTLPDGLLYLIALEAACLEIFERGQYALAGPKFFEKPQKPALSKGVEPGSHSTPFLSRLRRLALGI